VTFSGLTNPERWSFNVGTEHYSVPIRSRLAVNTAEAAIDAAVFGVGVTRVLSYQADQARATGTLRIVLKEFEPPSLPVNLLFPGNGPLPVKLRAFLDFAAPRLRARLANAD
jgi:DNA-binding transcriptional LysR family regulator